MLNRKPARVLSRDEIHAHPHWRRATEKYRRKKALVTNLWIGSGMVMCLMPPSAVIALALLTTFLAFMILDETE